jgi:hypothetical protein
MQSGNHEPNSGEGNAPAMTSRGSAALGLRVAMPVALLLWALVVTALWTLLH